MGDNSGHARQYVVVIIAQTVVLLHRKQLRGSLMPRGVAKGGKCPPPFFFQKMQEVCQLLASYQANAVLKFLIL